MSIDPAQVATLRVSAESSSMATVRVFVGAVAAMHGLQTEAVEDLKIVVSELCATAILARAGGFIEISIAPRSSGAQVTVRGALDMSEVGDDAAATDRGRLLDALVPDAVRADDPTFGSLIRFSMPQPST
jgi:hypothetical protein